ncbi:MaoC family dehydratase [Natronobiforma cellulositropha]|uniref:MaoC family dehydratase n=1 Tax=Natronobiforma cellulositropha TaxID=1679076 RepID=UPI0021D591FE|nr:MaoC family dehydratase [Natronobiforma cellulositropha]
MGEQNTGGNNFAAMTTAWTSVASSLIQGTTAANRAAVSALFPYASSANGVDACTDHEPETVPASIPSLEYEHLDWAFERTVDDPDHISVGDLVTFEKTITETDVRTFARASGDTNRLHLDEEFAAGTRFGERIAHGTLVSGLISAALARLPGLTIYLSQDLEFRAPVAIGDRVSARVEIVEDLGREQYRLETQIRDEDEQQVVIDGEAVVLIDDMPEN